MHIPTILTAACLLYALPSLTYQGTITNKSAKAIEFTLENQVSLFDSSNFASGIIPAGKSINYDSGSAYLIKPNFRTTDKSVRNHDWHTGFVQMGGHWTIFDSKKPWGFDWNHSWKEPAQ